MQKTLEQHLAEYSDDNIIQHIQAYRANERDKTIMLELVKRLKKALEGRS